MSNLPYHHDWKPRFEASLGLRVKWYGRWGGGPAWRIDPSRLASDLVYFFYLEQGRCTGVINDVPVPMRAGDLVVLRGGDAFSFSQDPDRLQTHLSACLALDRDDAENALLRLAYQRHYQLHDRHDYEQRFTAVVEALESTSRWSDLHVMAALFGWLAALQEALGPDPSPADNPKTVHHVLAAEQWIRRHMGEDVSIAAWSAACGLNADYFSRLFKTHTGLAPKAWLLEARLQQASRLLGDGDKSVAEVAAACGFNCPFHFSRTFKRRFGTPPAKYRQIPPNTANCAMSAASSGRIPGGTERESPVARAVDLFRAEGADPY